jgi:hypothetical protein
VYSVQGEVMPQPGLFLVVEQRNRLHGHDVVEGSQGIICLLGFVNQSQQLQTLLHTILTNQVAQLQNKLRGNGVVDVRGFGVSLAMFEPQSIGRRRTKV